MCVCDHSCACVLDGGELESHCDPILLSGGLGDKASQCLQRCVEQSFIKQPSYTHTHTHKRAGELGRRTGDRLQAIALAVSFG